VICGWRTWLGADPHPDLADTYAHVPKLGDSPRQRAVRIEDARRQRRPVNFEMRAGDPPRRHRRIGICAPAREVLGDRSRDALDPAGVRLLMAENRSAQLNMATSRTGRAVDIRTLAEPVATRCTIRLRMDRGRICLGYRRRGRYRAGDRAVLDAFQWQRPLAALPSDKNAGLIEAAEFNAAISAPTAASSLPA